MAIIQTRMISGRYRSEFLCRKWSKNKHGVCLLSKKCEFTIEDLPHILQFCPALQPTRDKLVQYTLSYAKRFPLVSNLLLTFLVPSHPLFCQFLLDCSTVSQSISAKQIHGFEIYEHLFEVTRTWCYSLHRERLKILGRWNVL